MDVQLYGILHGKMVRLVLWTLNPIQKAHNEHWLITRDMLAFLDSLCRVKSLDDEKLDELFNYYKSSFPTTYWTDMLSYVRRFRWLYYLLLVQTDCTNGPIGRLSVI